MKVRIIDKDALLAIQPAAMRAYLIAAGWVGQGPWGETSEIFVRDGTGRELLVPVRADLGDYASAMSDILGVLSEVEDRSELQVYADIRSQGDEKRDLHAIRRVAWEAIDSGKNPLIAVEAALPGALRDPRVKQIVRTVVHEWLEGSDED